MKGDEMGSRIRYKQNVPGLDIPDLATLSPKQSNPLGCYQVDMVSIFQLELGLPDVPVQPGLSRIWPIVPGRVPGKKNSQDLILKGFYFVELNKNSFK